MKTKSTIDEIKSALFDYFTLSRSQRRGSLFLLWLIFLLCSGFYFISFLKPSKVYDTSEFESEIRQLEEAMAKAKNDALLKENKYRQKFNFKSDTMAREEIRSVNTPIPFNPNTADEGTFIKNGLTSKQAQVILRYRDKGGKFRKKEDFKKMYCLTAGQYNQLEPFLIIPADSISPKIFKKDTIIIPAKVYNTFICDLNTSTQADFDSIKGIGPAIALSIIKYREKLGGYIKTDQILEVYGVDTVLYEKVKNQLSVSNKTIAKINLNTGFEDDLKHPYLNKTLAKLIINYRKLHGPFAEVEDLKKLALVNDELYVKLAPYLSVE